jgi:apolipoprotein D and lipocalin family protein
MRIPLLAFLILLGGLMLLQPALGSANQARSAVNAIAEVDLPRYMGRWYEIAHIPMFFQRKCVGGTTAEYTLTEKGTVSVLNSCDTASGRRIKAEGHARPTDTSVQGKLRVSFVRLFGRWVYAFGGDYWIIQLADDYSYAVVGHPSRDYGWILSRNPSLPPETLRIIVQQLKTQGYNPCRFQTTPQAGGFPEQKRLCDVVP